MNGHRSRKRSVQSGGGCETVLSGPSTHESVETLTDRICELLSGTPMQDNARFRLRMALHEALGNAVEHGNKNDPSKHVTVTCCCRTDHVALIVDDEGEGFDPGCIPDPTAAENLLRESGRGVFLIQRYADECRFENDGRRLVIIKRLS